MNNNEENDLDLLYKKLNTRIGQLEHKLLSAQEKDQRHPAVFALLVLLIFVSLDLWNKVFQHFLRDNVFKKSEYHWKDEMILGLVVVVIIIILFKKYGFSLTEISE